MAKTILITGAGTGIGRDTAIKLAKRGHQVIATTETEEQANVLGDEVKSLQLEMEIFKLDIMLKTDREQVRERQIDVLINNAGIGESGSLSEIDMNRVRNNFEVNVFSTFEMSQVALQNMMAKNHGTIINISSLAGRIPLNFLGPYSMTKFALSSGTETMRKEVHRVKKGVHICLIEPGGYHTGFNQKNIGKKYEWMDESSFFYPMIDQLKEEETRQFKLTEAKSTKSIVRKIVRAAEAKRPRLRYSAPGWQAIGVHILRMFGK